MIGAIGGIVVAPIASLQFDSGQFFTIFGFIAVAIGGMGSFLRRRRRRPGLGVAEQLAAGYISSLFSNAMAVVLLLVTLLLRPSGLFTTGLRGAKTCATSSRSTFGIVRFRARDVVIFGAVAVAVLMALPWFVPQSGGLLSSLVIAGILFIGVLGLDVLMGYAGQVSLGQAASWRSAATRRRFWPCSYGWPPLVGIRGGIVLSLDLRARALMVTMRLRGVYLALATLAFGLLSIR